MADRTEDEEERFVRRVADRMPVDPNHLAECLKPHSFTLIFADRNEGLNEIELLRPSLLLSGLFDSLQVKAGLRGDGTGVHVAVLIAPGAMGMSAISEFVPATVYGYRRPDDRPKLPVRANAFATDLPTRFLASLPIFTTRVPRYFMNKPPPPARPLSDT